MAKPLKPLLASYGGGHSKIIINLARALLDRGDELNLIGFTVAFQEMKANQLNPLSVETLIEPSEDKEWLALADQFIEKESHPLVSRGETRAYFALGLRDLCISYGRKAAINRVNREGRKAFEPVESMRRYLGRLKPDVVITTTSPRFELALLKAARLEGIPSLAIGDLFLIAEDWVLGPGYAKNLAVLSQEVADDLVNRGFLKNMIHVTGNPAFDHLKEWQDNEELRRSILQRLGCAGKKLILYPTPGGVEAMGRYFLDPQKVVNQLDDFCEKNKDYAYLVRFHPNRHPENLTVGQSGFIDNGSFLSAEDAVLASDVVLVENSTIGIQAALIGKKVICIRFGDEVPYVKYSLGLEADTLEHAISLITAGFSDDSYQFQSPPLGSATQNVISVIDSIVIK